MIEFPRYDWNDSSNGSSHVFFVIPYLSGLHIVHILPHLAAESTTN